MSSNPRVILTIPPEATSGHGNDNSYGDLIVSVNDVIKDSKGRTYKVLSLLGKGQFGHVYQVVNISSDSNPKPIYAMKITKSQIRYRQQAQHELQFLQHIQSHSTPTECSNISRLVDWFVYNDHICIVMELLSFDLYEVIKRRNYVGLPLQLIQVVMRQILGSLVILERCGIVHSDIKPENVLLTDGYSSSVKLIDFGSSRFISQPCSFYVQSRYYRAPEVVLGVPHDYKIDIWSMACVAFELFLGMPLFPGQSEVHLVHLIVDMLGNIPKQVIERAQRRNEFFLSNGQLKSEAQICREKGTTPVTFTPYFTYDTLDEIVYNYQPGLGNTAESMENERKRRALFLDLLKQMLALEPLDRINASTALLHPFLTSDLSKL